MLRYLHSLSAVCFYILGSSFFLAYIFFHNGIMAEASQAWMQIGDMPLLLSGILYGGLSVYRSISDETANSKTLMLGIGIPLVILFGLFLVLNFRV